MTNNEASFPVITDKTILGKHQTTSELVSVDDVNRQSGMYILGVQGVGKSSLIEQLIYQDIAKGYAVVVLDPHGDLIEHAIAQMPEERLSDVFLLDIEDTGFPFGLNLFDAPSSSEIAQQQALDRVLHVFEKCFPETSRMLLEKYLGNIAPVFFASSGGYGISDIPRFLRDDEFRTSLLGNVRFVIREFWEDEYGSLSASRRQTETASLSTRINRFVRSPISGNIIGQNKTSIDFRAAIEGKKIILVRLPIKTLREDATLIGTMLVAQIYAAIFSFADTPLEKRPGFSLFVDEFQHFATTDFAEMFTEGRKFGSRVCVAHQFREQLPDELASATLTAHTKICFQTSSEDASKMASLFVTKEEQVRKEDIVPDVVRHLLQYSHPHPAVDRFIKVYLRPVAAAQRRGGQIVVTSGPTEFENYMAGRRPNDMPLVPDPLPYLSPFLYEVEMKQDWLLPLPPHVVLGFGDMGGGVYQMLENCSVEQLHAFRHYETVLLPSGEPRPPFPLPGSPQAIGQLWDFLITLRHVMSVLSSSPIGEKKQITPSEVAQRLIALPKRSALVRESQGVTPIATLPIPAFVSDEEVARRKAAIQDRTRATYCKPRQVVEQEIQDRHKKHAASSSPQAKEYPGEEQQQQARFTEVEDE